MIKKVSNSKNVGEQENQHDSTANRTDKQSTRSPYSRSPLTSDFMDSRYESRIVHNGCPFDGSSNRAYKGNIEITRTGGTLSPPPQNRYFDIPLLSECTTIHITTEPKGRGNSHSR